MPEETNTAVVNPMRQTKHRFLKGYQWLNVTWHTEGTSFLRGRRNTGLMTEILRTMNSDQLCTALKRSRSGVTYYNQLLLTLQPLKWAENVANVEGRSAAVKPLSKMPKMISSQFKTRMNTMAPQFDCYLPLNAFLSLG